MKTFPILLGLLLFGFIYSNSGIIRDIEVLTTYTFISATSEYHFRLPVSSPDKLHIKLKTQNNENIIDNYKFEVCGFSSHPSDMEAMNVHESCAVLIPKIVQYINYIDYLYEFSTLDDVNYLALHITLNSRQYPYSLFIDSEKGSVVA